MPKIIPFSLADAFTPTPFQGNPAGVFFDDAGMLTPDECRLLCGEVHLESAFVSPAAPDSEADFRLRYFTSEIEVPLCGHATVAALVVLFHTGRLAFDDGDAASAVRVCVQTGIGNLRVFLTRANDAPHGVRVTLHQNPPVFGPEEGNETVRRVASALGCAVEAITRTELPVRRVSTGTPWLFVPVASRRAVDDAPADFGAITQLSRDTETFGIYVFTTERNAAQGNELQIWSRCFAPIAGLNEDPVTGSASGALGCYLAQHGVLPVPRYGGASFSTLQGFAGGRGGGVRVAIGKNGDAGYDRVSVMGEAVVVGEGQFTIA